MIEPGELKPILAALLLPPAGPLLLALSGLLVSAWRRRTGVAVCLLGLALLWLLSCNAAAVMLARSLLPQVEPLTRQKLAAADTQAIVVLGGGALPQAPEYGQPQPSAHTLARLRYGAWLARQSGQPLAFSGGIGWAAAGTRTATEGAVARRVAREDFGLELRWVDERSRDTAQNAQQLAALMRPARIRRIALVTDAWHMPRAVREFQRVGFEVTPAPTGFATPRERALLEWLPSAYGLESSRQILREWLALRVAR